MAMKVLQEMEKSDTLKPNDRTFNTLLKVWAQHKNPEKARHIISLMRAAGVRPDHVSFNTLAQVPSSTCNIL
jgi:pentatricopeptide repeat domain-containing protein 1